MGTYLRVGVDFERYTLGVEGRDFGNCWIARQKIENREFLLFI